MKSRVHTSNLNMVFGYRPLNAILVARFPVIMCIKKPNTKNTVSVKSDPTGTQLPQPVSRDNLSLSHKRTSHLFQGHPCLIDIYSERDTLMPNRMLRYLVNNSTVPPDLVNRKF